MKAMKAMKVIFLTAVALLVVVTLLEGWDFSGLRDNLATCFTVNRTLCLAVVTAVVAARPAGAGVGMLLLFGIHSLYLVVFTYGLVVWCSSRIGRALRNFCRDVISWIQWLQRLVRMVRFYIDVVASTLIFLGTLTALKAALEAVLLGKAPSEDEAATLKALKDFLGSVSKLIKSLSKLALAFAILLICNVGQLVS